MGLCTLHRAMSLTTLAEWEAGRGPLRRIGHRAVGLQREASASACVPLGVGLRPSTAAKELHEPREELELRGLRHG